MADRSSIAHARLVADEPSPLWRWLEALALVITAGVVIARGMMLETLREPNPPQPEQIAPPAAPGATTSLVLSLIACLPALIVLLQRALDRDHRTVRSLAFPLGLSLGGLAVLSTVWAADRFAAMVGAATLLSAMVLIWSTAHLVRDWTRLRLVIGICIGLLCVYVAHGVLYRLIDLPDLIRTWEEDVGGMRTRAFQEHNWREGDIQAIRFDRKIRSGEMIGFTASPNTFAAITITLGIVAAGLCVERGRWREWGALAAPVLAIVLAAWLVSYTQSKTAIATPLVAAILFVLVANQWLREWMAHHRRLVFGLGIIGVAIATAAVVGHGLYHDSLVIDSLTFRWRYWIASARLLADHPLLGVGYAGFGDHYTEYRLPIAAEEIRDPHNLVIRFLTELGILGGILAVTWEAARWWTMTRPSLPAGGDADAAVDSTHAAAAPGGASSSQSAGGTLALAGMTLLAGFLLNLICSVDFSQVGDHVFMEVAKRLLFLVMLGLGTALPLVRIHGSEVVLDRRAAPWLLYGTIIATAVFMLHSLIDFAFFEAGPMFIFALLCGAVFGMRGGDGTPRAAQRRPALIAAAAAGLLWLVALVAVVGPVMLAEDQAARGDELVRAGRPAAAVARYEDALSTLGINGDYAFRAAHALMYAGAPPQQVRAMIDRAIATKDRAVSFYLLRARHHLQVQPADPAPALADFERAVQLNPQDIDIRIEYARALAAAQLPGDARLQAEAALAINDAYHPDEGERLSEARLAEVKAFIASLAPNSP